MISMDLKGITWVGNLYHKFENMCLETEDMIYQDTVKYIENQMQGVGESVKKLYADVTRDLLLPSSCDFDDKVASELPTDQSSDVGFCKMTDEFTSSSGDSVKGNNFISCSRQCVQSMDIESDLDMDQHQTKKKMAATKIFDEITLAETSSCNTSQSCKLSNENQNQNGASIEQNASIEQFPNDPVLVKSVEEKQMNTSSSSGVLFGEPDDFSMDRTIDSDDCYSMVVLSYQDARSSDFTKIDTFLKQEHKTRQEDKLKLEETCVMVTGGELQFVHKQSGNVNTYKKDLGEEGRRSREREGLERGKVESESAIRTMENRGEAKRAAPNQVGNTAGQVQGQHDSGVEREQKSLENMREKSFPGGQSQLRERMEGEVAQIVGQIQGQQENAAQREQEPIENEAGETVAEIGETMIKPTKKVKQQGQEGKGDGVYFDETIAEMAETTNVILVGEKETEWRKSIESWPICPSSKGTV
ncbi:hypothetical protein TanjilG_11673 [Lupinus angustifolius]|uniref:Uncharacterized protein n=1 Tax=Lupinus angustifolius TaxID=3871 RepID=A0A1J7HHU3_LUPAN|nr:hypothetical protein TanjilG_11673 [Lupinus angustifolius]